MHSDAEIEWVKLLIFCHCDFVLGTALESDFMFFVDDIIDIERDASQNECHMVEWRD